MNHSVKSAVEYTIFAIGILFGIGICLLPVLVRYEVISESVMFAGTLTPAFGIIAIGVTIWWGLWAHNRCKKGVCEIQ